MQRAKGPDIIALVGHRRIEKAARLVDSGAADERSTLRPGKLPCDLVGQPGLHIERRVIQHRLRRRGIGIKLAARRRDLVEIRRVGFRTTRRLADPARRRAAGRHQLAIASRARLHHGSNRANRRDILQRRPDQRINFLRHGKAALGPRSAGKAFQFDPRLLAPAQISGNKILRSGRRRHRLRAIKSRPRRNLADRIDLPLQAINITAQRRNRLAMLLRFLGDQHRIKRRFQRIRLGFERVFGRAFHIIPFLGFSFKQA